MKKQDTRILKILAVDLFEIFMEADLAYQLIEAQVSGLEMFVKMFFAIILFRIMAIAIDNLFIPSASKKKIED